MREIVDDGYAAFDAADFHPPFDREKGIEAILDLFVRDAPSIRGDDHREAVPHVEFTEQRCLELAERVAFAKDGETRLLAGKINVACLPFRGVGEAERLDLCMKFAIHLGKHLTDDRRINSRDQPAAARHKIHQAGKFPLDVVYVVVNIRVVEFDIIDYCDLRQVVHKFRLLVEICRVVLIAFDHKEVGICHAKARIKVLHDPADQKTWVQAAGLADP